jgi:ferredoxin
MYRIEIDSSLCSGFGSCVDAAPELFRLGDDGIALVLVDEAADADAAVEAARSCPMGAIAVLDGQGRQAA